MLVVVEDRYYHLEQLEVVDQVVAEMLVLLQELLELLIQVVVVEQQELQVLLHQEVVVQVL